MLHNIKRVTATALAATVVGLGSIAAAELTNFAVALGPWYR